MDGPSLPVRRAAFVGVLALVALSVPATLLLGFRSGGYVLALALLLGGAARALLPDYLTLGLLVRSRRQDTATLLGLGVALLVATRIVPG
jgi:hypothetical protein